MRLSCVLVIWKQTYLPKHSPVYCVCERERKIRWKHMLCKEVKLWQDLLKIPNLTSSNQDGLERNLMDWKNRPFQRIHVIACIRKGSAKLSLLIYYSLKNRIVLIKRSKSSCTLFTPHQRKILKINAKWLRQARASNNPYKSREPYMLS